MKNKNKSKKTAPENKEVSKKKKFPVKEFIGIFTSVAAIVISIIGLLQSNYSIKSADDAASVNLVVRSKLFPEQYYKDGPYTDYFILIGPEPSLSSVYVNVLIQIDNLSQRDVSIRSISAIALADDGPRTLNSLSNPKETVLDDSPGISLYSHKTTGESTKLNLPLLLKSGESADIYGAIGITLSPEIMDILRKRGNSGNNSINTRQAFETFLREYNILLGGACRNSDCIGFGTVIETEPWHPLEINITVTTAFETNHNVTFYIP